MIGRLLSSGHKGLSRDMAQPWKRIKEPEISSPAHAGCARPGAMLPTWTRPGGQVTVSTARAPCDPFSHHVAPSCCHAHCPSPTRVPLCFRTVPFSSVAQSCPVLCDPMSRSTPGFPVHHHLREFTLSHVHRVGDAIQPSHPLSSPSPPAFNLSQHQGLF